VPGLGELGLIDDLYACVVHGGITFEEAEALIQRGDVGEVQGAVAHAWSAVEAEQRSCARCGGPLMAEGYARPVAGRCCWCAGVMPDGR